MKLSRAYPKRDIPMGIRRGVLFRGKAPANNNLKGGWQYLSVNEIVDFLGFSLAPLIPRAQVRSETTLMHYNSSDAFLRHRRHPRFSRPGPPPRRA